MARPLLVEMVRGVLDSAHKDAGLLRSPIKIIFDHHSKDDETKVRNKLREEKKPVHSIAEYQTRQEYSQEVIVENRYYDYIREPMFHIESHWSLGIQAADWVCSLLGKILSYRADHVRFADYRLFHDKLEHRLDNLTTEKSDIVGLTYRRTKQILLPLDYEPILAPARRLKTEVLINFDQKTDQQAP